jgi:hypothetical protein
MKLHACMLQKTEGKFLREMSVYKIASTPAVATCTCPKCRKSFNIPVKKKGEFYVFHPSIKCTACGKNVSKQFFRSLIADQVRFKWDRKFIVKKERKPALKPAKKPRKIPKQKVIYKSELAPEKPLSVQQTEAIKNFVSGMTKEKALITAGYSESTARTKADTVFGNVRIISTIQAVMEKHSLTLDTIIPVLKQGLVATKVISAMVIARGPEEGEPGEEMAPANSMTKDFVEVPDFKERRETVALSLKLLGYPAPDKKDEAAADNELPRTYEETRMKLGLDRHADIRDAMREFFIDLALKKRAAREVREKAAIES